MEVTIEYRDGTATVTDFDYIEQWDFSTFSIAEPRDCTTIIVWTGDEYDEYEEGEIVEVEP